MDTHRTLGTMLNFIPDEVATRDDFESHGRIAAAIAAVIKTRNDLKVIGLLGPWGSGKSSVVKFVCDHLGTENESENFFCFTYDAWLHQSDPPRRAFLEGLIRFLIEKGITEESRWNDRILELNRQIEETESTITPTLSTAGRWLLPSAFFVPFGIALINHDWFNEIGKKDGNWFEHYAFFAGIIFTILPIVVAAVLYLWWRPTRNPFVRKFWSKKNLSDHRSPHEKESILSIFTNREVQIQRNRLVRSPDPTTIEFQGIFREIMGAVSADGRRFLFVVDNLDRLPEAQAIEMWSTIRSFFLGQSSGVTLPTVILPVDESAVRRMYTDKHNEDVAQTLAQSFMDKTFDLTFRVTRPVLSNWQSYLGKQLKSLFGAAMENDWPYIVGSIYDRWLALRPKEPVTPRIINTLVNSIGTLWLQWQASGVSFPAIVYYLIHRDRFESDVIAAVSGTGDGIDEFDSNWRLSVAALHFGVDREHAAQVMLEPELRSAIAGNDLARFIELSGAPGFDPVFDRLLDKAIHKEAPLEISTLVRLYDAAGRSEASHSNAAWRKLCAIWTQADGASGLERNAPQTMATLLRHCPTQLKSDFLREAAAWLSRIPEAGYAKGNTITDLVDTVRVLNSEAVSVGIALPRVTISGDPMIFLRAIAGAAGEPEVTKCLAAGAPAAKVMETLAAGLIEAANAVAMASAVQALLATDSQVQWQPVIIAAGSKLEGAFDKLTEFSALALGYLQLPQAAAATRIQQLADTGILLTRFNEAYNANNQRAAAGLGALFLRTSNPATFAPPDGQSWDKVFEARPEFGQRLSELLREFGGDTRLSSYAKLEPRSGTFLPLIRALVSIEWRKGVLTLPPGDELIDHFNEYSRYFEPDAWIAFVSMAASTDDFWTKIETLPVTNSTPVLLALLDAASSARQRAATETLTKLERLGADEWTTVIDQGGDLYTLLRVAGEMIPEAEIKGNLNEALRQRISQFAVSDPTFRERWLSLADFVSRDSRTTLIRQIADHVARGDTIVDLSGLLKMRNAFLLRDGEIIRHPDGISTYVLLPLLKDSNELDWLFSTSSSFDAILAKADRSIWTTVQERLQALWQSSESVDRGRIEHIVQRWGMTLPVADDASGETASDAR